MEYQQPLGGRPLIVVELHGWPRIWYRRVMVNTVVFHAFAWFNCSFPATKGRFNRLMHPGAWLGW